MFSIPESVVNNVVVGIQKHVQTKLCSFNQSVFVVKNIKLVKRIRYFMNFQPSLNKSLMLTLGFRLVSNKKK